MFVKRNVFILYYDLEEKRHCSKIVRTSETHYPAGCGSKGTLTVGKAAHDGVAKNRSPPHAYVGLAQRY